MTSVDALITSWYSKKGEFKSYKLNFQVEDGFGGKRNFSEPVDIASELVLNAMISEVEAPEYRIKLWEGEHPLDKCGKNCNHKEYSVTPDSSLKTIIEDYIIDPEIIAAAREEADEVLDPASLNRVSTTHDLLPDKPVDYREK